MTNDDKATFDGEVLRDPVGAAVLGAVARANCRATLQHDIARIEHFVLRLSSPGRTPATCAIVVVNLHDPLGLSFAEACVAAEVISNTLTSARPGKTPFLRGIVQRAGLHDALDALGPEIAAEARAKPRLIVVFDHGTAAPFDVADVLP